MKNNTVSLDLGNLNQDNISNVSCMFGGYEYFNDAHGSNVQNINLYNFNKDNKMTSISGMFKNCVKLMRVNFDETCGFESITDVSYLFANCPAFYKYANSENQKQTLNSIDFTNVTNFSYMFSGLFDNNTPQNDSLYFSLEFESPNATNMEGMFSNNSHCAFITIYVDWFDSSKVVNMSSMFANCYNVCRINLQTHAVTPVNHSLLLDTRNVKNMSKMFYNCARLSYYEYDYNNEDMNSYIMKYLYFDSIEDISNMYNGCFSIECAAFKFYDSTKSSHVKNATMLFYNCPVQYVDFGNLYINYESVTDDELGTQIDATMGYETVFSGTPQEGDVSEYELHPDGYLYDWNGCYTSLKKVNFGDGYFCYDNWCSLGWLGVSPYVGGSTCWWGRPYAWCWIYWGTSTPDPDSLSAKELWEILKEDNLNNIDFVPFKDATEICKSGCYELSSTQVQLDHQSSWYAGKEYNSYYTVTANDTGDKIVENYDEYIRLYLPYSNRSGWNVIFNCIEVKNVSHDQQYYKFELEIGTHKYILELFGDEYKTGYAAISIWFKPKIDYKRMYDSYGSDSITGPSKREYGDANWNYKYITLNPYWSGI